MPAMDYSRLLGRLRERGLTQKELAAIVGISEGQMSQKIQGNYPFKQSEIGSVCDTLGIDHSDIGLYFFTPKVEKSQPIQK
jgi:transcriptional regulator with XRE-family HTH domain